MTERLHGKQADLAPPLAGGSPAASGGAKSQTDPRRAVFTVFIRGTIQKVWHEITKTDSPQLCMFNMKLRTTGLKKGAPIRADTKSGKYTGVVGEVLEFD